MTEPQATGLNDAHCHFFSAGFFATLGRDPSAPPARDPAVDLPAALGWDPPGPPAALADRWVAELDHHGVTRAAIMASVPGDERSVAEAVAKHPTRLTGTFMLNPTAPDASARVRQGFGERGLRCAASSRRCTGSCSTTNGSSRCSRLRPSAGARCSCTAASCRSASGASWVCRHGSTSGAGTRSPSSRSPRRSPMCRSSFPTSAPVSSARPSWRPTFAQTSTSIRQVSNAWTKYTPGLRLVDVFRQALAVLGPERILFGSDSSFFPRGWQHTVLDAQRAALDEIALDAESRAAIFAGNFNRVFGGGNLVSG